MPSRRLAPPDDQLRAAPRRGGLGRGLGALIPTTGSGLLEVDVDRVIPNPDQPRYAIDEAALDELADSIRRHGLLQPLVVTRSEDGGERYTLIAGERRWRAARAAGLRTVPIVIKEATPRQRLELALVENLQRQDLNPLETAQAYRQLIDEHGLTQDEIAERVGKSRVAVANTLRLLALPVEARDALASGEISEGHARAILTCQRVKDRQVLLRAILEHGLSVREAEEQARRFRDTAARGGDLHAPQADQSTATALRARPADPELASIEDQLRLALGTRVQLQRSRQGGRLIIHFYSDEQLQGLYEQIVGHEPR